MSVYFILFSILFPIISGALILPISFKKRKNRQIYVFSAVVINSIMTGILALTRPSGSFTLINFSETVSISFKVDGLGALFAGLVAFLWPLATLYAFEYMKHENRENIFFAFYTMTYGVTLGVAFSSNAITLYLFYELLTLITTPLVFHSQTKEAIHAARKYLSYSISGAALAFIAVIFIVLYSRVPEFTYGGVINFDKALFQSDMLLVAYVLAFVGFGVKAAIFPLHGWLPTASAAPTPVTALLHAVAVVKAGAFAIIRMTYYVFGTEFLSGTWAQVVVSIIAIVTIIFGSSMAVKEQHFKKRLAYSTVSNLSYILVGVTLMTPLGLIGALTHMVFHAIMKITSFFSAGAVIVQTGKEYVGELEGLGKRMPITFTCFTVASLSLVGVPPLIGFVSKFNLAKAAVSEGTALAYISMAALFISAILVAIYMLFVVIKAFFPRDNSISVGDYHDPGWMMKLPIIFLSVLIIVVGIYSEPIVNYISLIAYGMI